MNSKLTSRKHVLFVVCLVTATLVAAAFRLARLDARPMHGDEANQAVKAAELFESGQYRYDPEEHHGPTLYWLTLPSLCLSGAEEFSETTESAYRVVPVVFGIGLVLLLLLVADGLGRGPAVIAGVLTAVSPAMVFYSRYYIQEMLLVFFTLGAIGCGWRYLRSRRLVWARLVWAILGGAFVGLMHATKETWVLAATATFLAAMMTWGWPLVVARLPSRRASNPRSGGSTETQGNPVAVEAELAGANHFVAFLAFALAACAVVVLLYSSFGRHWRGPWESIVAYQTYFRRGGEGGIHAHSWPFYLDLLVTPRRITRRLFTTEAMIVGLAIVGFATALILAARKRAESTCSAESRCSRSGPHPTFAVFLAFYTLLLTVLYAAVRYKTPWCMLGFLHGMILSAGIGAWAIARLLPGRVLKSVACILLLAGVAHLGWASYALNFRFPADPRNPYVYAHSASDVLKLADRMERLAEVSPEGHGMFIHVVSSENYWPLPWYLRKFDRDRIGYWQDATTWLAETKEMPAPSVVMLTAEAQDAVDAALAGRYQPMVYGLRPGVLVTLYVRKDLWAAVIAEQ